MQKFIVILVVLSCLTVALNAADRQSTDVPGSPSSRHLVSQSWHNEPDNKDQVRDSKAEVRPSEDEKKAPIPLAPATKNKKPWYSCLLCCCCSANDEVTKA